ncbi:hypothetical protein UFOVP242_204 [uncultured Caudovirales phage]|uniref:Uncharacterized protein n=1 Tax=uncultured Caudovirales phage TaxID=2100421 RepID=A0A6J7WW67_9CAUD|nr:hypothetical protein UFOVP242_204 [uncultured Caudovirales phage]
MEVIEFPGSIFISRVSNYKEVNQALLNIIAQDKNGNTEKSDCQRISKTDFFNESPRLYHDILLPHIENHAGNILEQINGTAWQISKLWYQQYGTGDYHSWHFHNCSLSSIYYIELDSQGSRTSFQCRGKEFSLDVEEGHLITFPSYLSHQSRPNKGNRKTVISFNMEIS